MSDPLSVIAGGIAIFDALKEAYRFAKDVIKAPEERAEFTKRLDCVADIKKILDDCLAKENDPENSRWIQLLSPEKNVNSPLAGLLDIMTKMLKTLELKETTFRQKMKDFKWHSEKKSLEGFFVAIDGCCTRIVLFLSTANIEISRLSRENNTLLKDTNAITKKMAANQEAQIEADKLVRQDSDRKAIERWLSPLEFQARQREIFEPAVKTGKKFLELEEFKLWKRGELEVLRCHGRVGTGKTVLSSIVVDHLREQTHSRTPVICLFLEKASSAIHSPKNLLGSLVKQLVQLKSDDSGISPGVREAWKKETRLDARPSQEILKKLLKSEAEAVEYDWVYIVVDALDEASEESRSFIERELRRVSKKLKLLTMSRVDEDPPREFVWCTICEEEGREKKALPVYYRCTGCPKKPRFDLCPSCKEQGYLCNTDPFHEVLLPKVIEVLIQVPLDELEACVRAILKDQAPEEDIDLDMESPNRLSTTLGRFCSEDEKFMDEIVEAVLENSYEKYLLAKLYMKSVSTKATKKEVKSARKKLQGTEYDLSDRIDILYEQDLKARIKGQSSSEDVERGIKILSIVYFARRNLSLDELRQVWVAEVTEPGDTEYDADGILESQQILNCTGGFITIGREDEVVRLDDRTLREYFDKKHDEWFPEGEKKFAILCLRYLGFDIFSKPCAAEKLAARDEEHPFFAYAVQYCGDHVREAGSDPEVQEAATKYVQDGPRMEAYIQGAWETNTHDHDKWDVRRNIHALHVCAWFNLADLIEELDFKTIGDLNVQERTYGQTPLMYASRRGNKDVAQRLLSMGARANISSARGRTALHEAVLRKNNEMTQLLLENAPDLDVNARNPTNFDRPALMLAIRQGCSDIANTILRDQNLSIEIDMQDSQGNTALSLAALSNLGDVVETLLSLSANQDLVEKSDGRSAMIIASVKNHAEIVLRLLKHGADPNNPRDSRGGTPALRAVEAGNIETLTLLIEYKADLSCVDEDGRTLTHCAAEFGHVGILELLKEHQQNLNSPCQHGMTPLHSACRIGESDAAEFLIENGADCAIKDKFERTPYMVAWQYGKTELMDLLRDKGTNREIDSAHNIQTEGLPIWSLVSLCRLDLVTKASTAKPFDISLKEPVTGNTALHCAIRNCENGSGAQMLEQLLSANAKWINEPNRGKKTPLHLAVSYGCLDCTTALLKFKPSLDEVDRYSNTALAIACSHEYLAIAVSLVEAGAKINDTKYAMQKLLFAAIEFQSLKAVENLMLAGADRMAQDEYGRTADILAKQLDAGEILRVLQSHRSFLYHAPRSEKSATSTVEEVVDVPEERPELKIAYRPSFPRPAGLDEGLAAG